MLELRHSSRGKSRHASRRLRYEPLETRTMLAASVVPLGTNDFVARDDADLHEQLRALVRDSMLDVIGNETNLRDFTVEFSDQGRVLEGGMLRKRVVLSLDHFVAPDGRIDADRADVTYFEYEAIYFETTRGQLQASRWSLPAGPSGLDPIRTDVELGYSWNLTLAAIENLASGTVGNAEPTALKASGLDVDSRSQLLQEPGRSTDQKQVAPISSRAVDMLLSQPDLADSEALEAATVVGEPHEARGGQAQVHEASDELAMVTADAASTDAAADQSLPQSRAWLPDGMLPIVDETPWDKSASQWAVIGATGPLPLLQSFMQWSDIEEAAGASLSATADIVQWPLSGPADSEDLSSGSMTWQYSAGAVIAAVGYWTVTSRVLSSETRDTRTHTVTSGA